jgi:hypothetical protein
MNKEGVRDSFLFCCRHSSTIDQALRLSIVYRLFSPFELLFACDQVVCANVNNRLEWRVVTG